MKTNQIFTLSFSSFLLKGSSSSSKESEKFFFFPENDPLWILFLSLSLPLPLSLTLFLGELNPEKITTVIIIKKNVKKYEKKLYRKFFFSFSIKSNQQQPYHHSLLLLWFVNIYFFPIILHFIFHLLTHSLLLITINPNTIMYKEEEEDISKIWRFLLKRIPEMNTETYCIFSSIFR